MKKFLLQLFVLILSLNLVSCTSEQNLSMKNPWSDCNDNFVSASKIAGFSFPLILSNYKVRAMNGMIEVIYPLDEVREVVVRKSDKCQNGDISGVYYDYPLNKEIRLRNGVLVKIRGDKDKIYVMNMSGANGYYSAYSKEGMSLEEVEEIYKIIEETESEKYEEY